MGKSKLRLLSIFALISLVSSDFNVTKCVVNYGEDFTRTINKSIEYILEFKPPEKLKLPPRVTVSSSNAAMSAPLMIVARQPRQMLSWQLPLTIDDDSTSNVIFDKTSRTLCHDQNSNHPKGIQIGRDYYNPVVTLATVSESDVDFTVKVDYEKDFVVNPSVSYDVSISPSEPKYFYYDFPVNISDNIKRDSNYDTVILEVHSPDDVCMTVSIQNVTCPVFDTNADITFRGFYETVNRQGGITIPKYKFPHGFYAVFVAKADNTDCDSDSSSTAPNYAPKNFTLIVKPSITYDDYLNAVLATFGCIFGFFVVFGIGLCYCTTRGYVPRQMEYVSEARTPSTAEADIADRISVDESEYDSIVEAEQDRALRYGKPELFLSDLARKDPQVLKYKSQLYLYNVLTIAVFYGLPVVQLVVTYQKVLNQTGQQDLCYYNFLCAHPVGVISDFNHVFSNIGYVLLGVLFLWITRRREITHSDPDFERQYGIPQHYGMFYAMGVALIMEGVLSGSYHVCPNQANFQFDSSFMYVMAVLCIVKLYQNRHPDINARAYTTFGVLAVAILLGMIGILEGTLYFWVVFTVIYITAVFYISAEFYFMGNWNLDRGVFRRVYRSVTTDYQSGAVNVIKPVHTARMFVIILGNVMNWILAFWGLYRHQKDFALFLLAIFMANTLLYFVFYVMMKGLYKERISKLSLMFLTFSAVCACSAMYFFLHKSISWSKSPAESRNYNQECKLLQFYDYHDIWHFLSAIGMFFTFMVLLTLDDDLSHTLRSQIRVF